MRFICPLLVEVAAPRLPAPILPEGGNEVNGAALTCAPAADTRATHGYDPQPLDPSSPAPADRPLLKWTHAIYALHALSLLTGIIGAASVVGAFLIGWPSIIAVILNYMKRGEARGTWLESHFRWQIRTFWWGFSWAASASCWSVGTLGIGLLIVWVLGVVLGVWFIYRIAIGWMRLVDRKPMYARPRRRRSRGSACAGPSRWAMQFSRLTRHGARASTIVTEVFSHRSGASVPSASARWRAASERHTRPCVTTASVPSVAALSAHLPGAVRARGTPPTSRRWAGRSPGRRGRSPGRRRACPASPKFRSCRSGSKASGAPVAARRRSAVATARARSLERICATPSPASRRASAAA